MFDFRISLEADYVETILPSKMIETLGPIDPSVDQLIFDNIPINRVDLP